MRNHISLGMNDTQPATMSSREIAELLGSRHDKVKQSMERLKSRGLIGYTPMGEMVEIGSGAHRETKIYNVSKRDSYVVVAQLSPTFTARLVDRWQELEEQAVRGSNVPKSFRGALLLAAEQQLLIEQKQAQIEHMKPAAELGARVVESERSVMRFVRTLPGVNTQQVHKTLAKLGYLYKRDSAWRVKRDKNQYFDERLIDGTNIHVKIIATGKWQKLLVGLYNEGILPMKLDCNVETVSFQEDGSLTHAGKQEMLLS